MNYARCFISMIFLFSHSVNANVFEGLYELGKENNLLLKAQNALQEADKQQENISFSRLLPRVSLLGNSNYQKQKSEIRSDNYLMTIPDRRNQTDGFGYEFLVTQPLFNLPAYYNYEKDIVVSSRADLEKLQSNSDYFQEFSQTYLNVVAGWQRIANINETLVAYSAQRDLIEKQYENGIVRPSDLQQAQASLATLKAESIIVKNNLSVSFERLELLLQSPVMSLRGMVSELESIDTFNKSLDEYVSEFRNNVDYKVANADVEIANKELQANSSLSLPTVAASLRYNNNQFDNTFDYQSGSTLYQDGWTIGVQVTIPLYAGGGDTYQKRASTYNYQSAKFQRQFMEHQTRQSIRTTYLNLKAGIELVKARKDAVLASRSALINANKEYRVGIGQYTDVRNNQDRLYEETNRLILDKVNLISSYFALARLIGETPDTTVKNMKLIFTGEVIENAS